ncbi:class I SAM-dependent methyltransferase [Parvibaculum sp.]|uniref:class I SAM-dependent methyltransferase n=1 Tax=Parvibaculum sp. TaxID=2024848 RepID=UPI00320FD7B8
MKAQDLYVGERGQRYHLLRAKRRAAPIQERRAALFRDVVRPDATVLDFGCGTGGVLRALNVKRRIGIEINEAAAAEAARCLDEVHDTLGKVADAAVDTVISFHALEHVDAPAEIIHEIFRVLRPGGIVKIFVPCEMPFLLPLHRKWAAEDIDMHLFSWTPLTLGNLVHVGGFQNITAEMIPYSEGGRPGGFFAPGTKGRYLASLLKALRTGRFHTRVTAQKPCLVSADSP